MQKLAESYQNDTMMKSENEACGTNINIFFFFLNIAFFLIWDYYIYTRCETSPHKSALEALRLTTAFLEEKKKERTLEEKKKSRFEHLNLELIWLFFFFFL